MSQTVRRLLQGLLAAVTGTVLASVFWLSGGLDSFEARTYDWRARTLASAPTSIPPIRVILLDQASLDWAARENGLSWPWPREVYGVVADFCRRAGARGLAFDVVYSEVSKYGVADDRQFAQAMAEYGRVVLPVFLGRDTGDAAVWPEYAPPAGLHIANLESWTGGARHRALSLSRASFPVPELAGSAALLGNVHQNPDRDGVFRRATLFSLFADQAVPSLALAAYLTAHPGASLAVDEAGLLLDGRAVALDAAGQALLRYHDPAGTYRICSAASVIQSELLLREGQTAPLDPEDFRGAYVLFGFSAPGLFDLRPSPISGVYSGVEIQAQILADMLAGDFLRDPHPAVCILLALCTALGAGLLCSLGAGTVSALVSAGLFLPLPLGLAGAGYLSGWNIPLLLLETAVGVSLATSVLTGYATEGRQKRFIKSAFRQYLSPDVIEQLLQHPERMCLGGERRMLSMFFSDLENFTSLSEGLSPEDLTRFLNEYLTAMTDIIMDEGGTVDKYEGDAIIAFWNAPLDQPDHADRALRAALRCQDRLAELRPSFRERLGRDLRMRIGLNTGPAVVGNMGSHSRFDYTMLGDSVNLAARLEGINKEFGTYTMISAAVLDAVIGRYGVREVGRVVVVGRTEPVTVFEPMWPDIYAARRETLEQFSRGLRLYYDGDCAQARTLFETLPEDPVAAAYVRQIGTSAAAGDYAVPGVWRMTSK